MFKKKHRTINYDNIIRFVGLYEVYKCEIEQFYDLIFSSRILGERGNELNL